MSGGFQRARTEEQRAQRATQIRDAARSLLGAGTVESVSLRAIAAETGLAASNVLRHLGSRESILLDVMDLEYVEWIAELDGLLATDGRSDVDTVALVLASSLGRRAVLGQLIAASPALLAHTPVAAAADRARSREQGGRNAESLTRLVERALGVSFGPRGRDYFVAGLHAVVSAASAWSAQGVFPVDADAAVRDLVAIQLAGQLARSN